MKNIDVKEIPWWKKTTVYQIYPRSYMDSNGNGIGDLAGIISKLDYIKDLGVETIWFSPFYESPTYKPYEEHDCGYDIMNYRGINAEYGDMDQCDTLIEEIHERDMKIVLDMVLNHTSMEHPWFQESRSSTDNPKRDWYIWKKGKKPTPERPGGKKPPNNWQAMITGSGWHYDKATDEYYWAQFLPFQPDLNYRNPEVQEEMLNTIRFWLKKKADGFRLDIINALFEDAQFRDNPFTWQLIPSDNNEAQLFRNPINTLNHPDTIEFMKKLRSTIDEFGDPSRFMVGEVSASLHTLKRYLGENHDGLNLVFLFQSLSTPLKKKKMQKLIELYERYFPYPYWPTWVFGNHDRTRRASRLGGSLLKAKLNAALQLTTRGVPFIYYGEEIGMEDGYTPLKESRDALVNFFGWIPEFVNKLIYKIAGESLNRDYCRTPMQWNSSENAGFSPEGARTWLPVTESYKERNVENMLAEDDSILYCYRRLLKARRETPALHAGGLRILDVNSAPKPVLVYERSANLGNKQQYAYAFLNFSDDEHTFLNPMKDPEFLVSTTINNEPLKEGKIRLTPWEGLVLLEK